jgi:hypothetical protein
MIVADPREHRSGTGTPKELDETYGSKLNPKSISGGSKPDFITLTYC